MMFLLRIINFPRSVILWLIISVLKLEEIFIQDLMRYNHFENAVPIKNLFVLNKVLTEKKLFHNQCIFRIKQANRAIGYLVQLILSRKYDLEICGGEIDGGLKIFHGHGTVIVCRKAGKNLTIYQGATIGKNNGSGVNGGGPIIGNNVTVYTNAVVAGEITIGDNVKIGVGCVVLKDVPDNTVVYGNPCIYKKMGD